MARTPEEAEKNSNEETTRRTYSKRTFENRTNGGPVTRAKTQKMEKKKVQKLCIQMQYKIPATIYIYKVLHKKLSAQYSRQYGAHMDTQNNKKYTDPKIDQEKTDAHKGPSSRK
jgi:hypothetical protein